jgi:hypothetical protein
MKPAICRNRRIIDSGDLVSRLMLIRRLRQRLMQPAFQPRTLNFGLFHSSNQLDGNQNAVKWPSSLLRCLSSCSTSLRRES